MAQNSIHQTEAGSRTGNKDRSQFIIKVENLSVGYSEEAFILDDVSFSVSQGEVLAILGHSGCGKTTLFKALIGLLQPAKGRISIGGQTLDPKWSAQSLANIRRQVGVLFQSGALLDWLTVGENVAFWLREGTDLPEDLIQQIVRLKLEMVKLESSMHIMPSELSGGMLRRASLAAAMALDPPVLLCDEPTSGLDPFTAMGIDQILLEINKSLDMTLLVVTHEVMTLENIASRCMMLDSEYKGIIDSGSLNDLRYNSKHPQVRSFFQRRIDDKHSQQGK
ncbi:MAG: ATP-binding cassette domain-containing protein [Desulfovermiculus sp.]